jgi:hypothetical protein
LLIWHKYSWQNIESHQNLLQIKMESQMACRFLNGLFGPNSEPAPVWGDQQDLALLARALDAGLSICNTVSTAGLSEASHAMETAVGWLQKTGKAPIDLQKVLSLSDEQRVAFGFEPSAVASDPAASVQNMGVPPFQNLDVAEFLAALRFVARYQQLKTGFKPVFQVGVLTLTVQGREQQFFAQTLATELGEVTETVWLYRWCVHGVDGQVDEHWRTFDGPAGTSALSTGVPSHQQTTTHNATDHGNHFSSPDAPSVATSPQPKARKPRVKGWQHFQHAHLSDNELFAAPPHLLQGGVILCLAHNYSNQEIFENINTAQPQGSGIRSVNVITKRLTHAIQAEAEASGRSVQDIRAQIAEAKSSRGIVHKGKVDVTMYGRG